MPSHVHEATGECEWGARWIDCYPDKREHFNRWHPTKTETAEPYDAARFLWMNRACFNGLYRVNASGEFNAPAGDYKSLSRPTLKEVQSFGIALSGVELLTADTCDVIDTAGEGDQVYADPPYYDLYDQYTAARFPYSAHVRLAESCSGAVRRGAVVVISNTNHEAIRGLYRGLGFQLRFVSVHRSIAASAESRGRESELLAVGGLPAAR